jgi:CRISPR-associated protein Csb2
LNVLLKKLANNPPDFYLPLLSWGGPPIKQYLPTEVSWTDKKASEPGYKKPSTSLNEDHYQALSPDATIYWVWPNIENIDTDLLDVLLARVLYFGRAESWTQIKRLEHLPENLEGRCALEKENHKNSVPVLSPIPEKELNLDALLAPTESPSIKNKKIPPGTVWLYAKRPQIPKIQNQLIMKLKYPANLNLLQFVVGGRVFPPLERWVTVVERFRGGVLRERFRQLTGECAVSYSMLTSEQKSAVELISGKNCAGQRLVNHPHAFFALVPDENGQPARLVAWRETPFTEDEIDAFMKATEHEIGWDYAPPKWTIKIIPLPFETTPPSAFLKRGSTIWKSLTPFVPPSARHKLRKNGKARASEMPENIILKLLKNRGLPVPKNIKILNRNNEWIESNPALMISERKTQWVSAHRSFSIRKNQKDIKKPNLMLGYSMCITFKEPFVGPLMLGESCHYGLGLFVPCDDTSENKGNG